MEGRTSFDLQQNLQVCNVLISLALLVVSLHGGGLSLLVPGHAQMLLFEENISQVFGNFTLVGIDFRRGGNDKLLVCSIQRN